MRLSRFLAIPLLALANSCSGFMTDSVDRDPKVASESLYDFSATSLAGAQEPLSAYRGSVTLVVNTASQCGFTSQYKDLQDLQTTYGERGFHVLGFPSADFGGQEFDTAGEVREFCDSKFGVTFPLFEISKVKAGEQQSPIYGFLGKASGSLPGWNFGKYLVDRDGHVLGFYPSQVNPMDKDLRSAIEDALESKTSN